MKGIHIFCASQAATAICLSNMEEASSSSSSPNILLSSSPAIDRCNPIIRDSTRLAKTVTPHNPHKLHSKKKKKSKRTIPSKENENHPNKSGSSSTPTVLNDDKITKEDDGHAVVAANIKKSWNCSRPNGDLISPPGSTRYLLREKVLFNNLSDFEEASESKDVQTEDAKQPSSSHSPDQVVVLRVSLHCRGCERKMRKHLSRMEGVTSFDIDFAAKKVTVTGNVTPVGVLSSISKVKNAQLWSPTISSSPLHNLSNTEFKNEFKGAGA